MPIGAWEGRQVFERAAAEEWLGPDGRSLLIVLLPGAGGTASSTYSALVPTLSRWSRVLALELPVSGRVAGDRASSTLDEVADAVASVVMTHCRGERVALVGNSLGGNVALRTRRRHKGLIDDLVVAAIALDTHPGLRLWSQVCAGLWDRDTDLAARFLVLSTIDPSRLEGFDVESVEIVVGLVAASLSEYTGLHLDLLSSLLGARDDVAESGVVHVLLGASDFLVPIAPWRDLERDSSEVQVRVSPGGHDVLTARPHASAAWLRSILLGS